MNIKISFIIIFLFPSLLWAQVDTLRPTGDLNGTYWTASGCVSDWQCIDEAVADGDGTHLYSIGNNDVNGFDVAFFHGSGRLDSVTMVINGRAVEVFDDFDDNSLDTDKWIERVVGSGSDASEEEQRLELQLDHTSGSVKGAGIFTKSKYNRTSAYRITYKYQTNYDQETGTEYGYKGFFIIPGDTSGLFETNYGSPEEGIWIGFGHGCGYDNDGIRIMADDDGGWECSWDDMIDSINADILEVDTWYDVAVYFNGSTGLCSMIVEMAGDDSVITGTVSSADLTNLGDSIRFHFHASHHSAANADKEDRYDDVYLDPRTVDPCTVLYGQGSHATSQFCSSIDTGLVEFTSTSYAEFSHTWSVDCDDNAWTWIEFNDSDLAWMFKAPAGGSMQRRLTQAFLIAHWTPYKLNPIVSTGDLEAIVNSGTLRRVVDGSP